MWRAGLSLLMAARPTDVVDGRYIFGPQTWKKGHLVHTSVVCCYMVRLWMLPSGHFMRNCCKLKLNGASVFV